MAFIDVYYALSGSADTVWMVSPRPLSGFNYIYNVTAAVGAGAPNFTEDVELVQTILATVAPKIPGLQSGLPIDGRFGPQTQNQILTFQKYLKAARASITTDGRVDRARGGSGSISHTMYTIHYLNDALWQLNHAYFPDIDSDMDTSWPLPRVLWRIRARGVAHMSV